MADLLAICTGIVCHGRKFSGWQQQKNHHKGDDCEECIHDLQRYLRGRWNQKHISIFRQCGPRCASKQALPLMTYHLRQNWFFCDQSSCHDDYASRRKWGMQKRNADMIKYKEAFLQDVLGLCPCSKNCCHTTASQNRRRQHAY